ncbi:hypothetical protein Golax_022426, partial [Gossypium laxum]|nr:hypothetical protein [Gossypium laxum]
SGGDDRERRDEISLLAEELVQLLVKGSKVVPSSKPTLICTVWTEKMYNPDSFRAHMKGIWKTRKKFEIQNGAWVEQLHSDTTWKKSKVSDNPPYLVALKAESKLIGKENGGFTGKFKSKERGEILRRVQTGDTTKKAKSYVRKRKSLDADLTSFFQENNRDGSKRLKRNTQVDYDIGLSVMMTDNVEQSEGQDLMRSAAANRQADQTQ